MLDNALKIIAKLLQDLSLPHVPVEQWQMENLETLNWIHAQATHLSNTAANQIYGPSYTQRVQYTLLT